MIWKILSVLCVVCLGVSVVCVVSLADWRVIAGFFIGGVVFGFAAIGSMLEIVIEVVKKNAKSQ